MKLIISSKMLASTRLMEDHGSARFGSHDVVNRLDSARSEFTNFHHLTRFVEFATMTRLGSKKRFVRLGSY